MSDDSKIDMALRIITVDPRITVWHISLYIAILHCWYENDFKTPISISRSKLMKFSHICSIATYHKCIKQLTDYGYIGYFPSYNPLRGTTIFLQVG
jgi:hypothetical protein